MAKNTLATMSVIASAPVNAGFQNDFGPAKVLGTTFVKETKEGDGYIGILCEDDSGKHKLPMSYEQLKTEKDYAKYFDVNDDGKGELIAGTNFTITNGVVEMYAD